MNPKSTDLITFKVLSAKSGGTVLATFPRVRSNFKFENKPIYTNVNTSQTGVTSQTFVRDQIVISSVNFDPLSPAEYAILAKALNIGESSGGAFWLQFFNFTANAVDTRKFIVKSLPVTVLTMTDSVKRLQIDAASFQEV